MNALGGQDNEPTFYGHLCLPSPEAMAKAVKRGEGVPSSDHKVLGTQTGLAKIGR
jgi:hypothetical protein